MSLPGPRYGRDNCPPTSSTSKIKCTYPDCFRQFSNEKDMKSHKKREPSHEYCHKCDVDCEDDSDLLIHMIESDRHIVCPMCGIEFKSNAGLEAHIPQTHQHTQSLLCIGCSEKFARAAALMKHIEDDECNGISQDMFQRRRAEKAITRDAWAAQLKPDDKSVPRGNNPTFSDTEANAQGGVSLIDERHMHESVTQKNFRPDYLTPSLNLLTLQEQFPELPNRNATKPGRAADRNKENDGTSSTTDHGQGIWIKGKPAWSISSPTSSSEGPKRKDSRGSIDRDGNVSGSVGSPPPFLTDPHAHLTTKPAPLTPASILDPMSFFNNFTNKFECPGANCGGIFTSMEAFNSHLTSGAHAGGGTRCPCCLKRFSSTMALVAHCEAPSKKCNIRKTAGYDQVLRDITGGLIGTGGHHIDGSVRYVANDISKSGFW